MSTLLDKVTTYFDRDPELRVLFIFHDNFLADDLDRLEWPEGYRWVRFKGDWFTTKYRLDNEWQNDKVVLYFEQYSPLEHKSLQKDFPLMDVLVANMEFHTQDSAAFMQQYDLPQSMFNFVDKNIQQLQSSKMMKMLEAYYRDGSITVDMGIRAFICSYFGLTHILDWDHIFLELIFLGRASQKKKRMDVFTRLHKNKMMAQRLQERLVGIFGFGYDDNTDEKVGKIVQVLKYNAIVQNLAPVEADDYKKYRITDSLALQQINRLIELAQSQANTSLALSETMAELGGNIKDENIIKWYGTDAKYSYVPNGLLVPIIKTLMSDELETEPSAVLHSVEELIIRHNADDSISLSMSYAIEAARYYETAGSVDTMTLNTPDDYVAAYQRQWYQIDQLYRQSLETYFKLKPTDLLFDTMQKVKKQIDQHYAKLTNRMNLEWSKCIQEAGGMQSLHILRQTDFYEQKVKPVEKKVAVIISDAMRYEVAQELMTELAKSKHVAHLEAALAVLPTETKYCKPSLLPHRRLKFYGNENGQDMSVDDKVLDTTEKRTQHLKHYKEDAICVDYDYISDYDWDKNREVFKYKLVYVMHDYIDHDSHGGTARDVVESCRKTVHDLDLIMRRIHDKYNVREIIVTSDHGFLFNDINFQDKDKLKVDEEALEKKSRYYLTTSEKAVNGIVKYRLSDVSGMKEAGNIFVAVPEGTNRLAVAGGDYVFAHGGASMEEMIIPVLISEYERYDTKNQVGVMILDRNLSIQASRLRFKLLQTDAVSMEMKERVVTCALYDGEEPVTPIKTYTLDKTSPSLDDRKIQVDLTLNKKVGNKVLQLRVYDSKDTDNPLVKENVTNKTLIENDFDF